MTKFNAQLSLNRMKYTQMSSFQAEQRAREWEIEKMSLRSRETFQREERIRAQKLDGIDNSLTQINKEILAGRMSEDEAYPLRLKLELDRNEVDMPTSLIPKEQSEEKQYGIKPHWMEYLAPEYEGTDERRFAESQMSEGIGGRTGTIPYYLNAEWLRDNPEIGEQVLASKEIFFDTPKKYKEYVDRLIKKTEEDDILLDDVDRADMAKGKQQELKPLDATTATAILDSVGGDKEKAREIARQQGYSF